MVFLGQMNGLLTITEVADILRLNRKTVWRYVKGGKLKAQKIGTALNSHYRIRKEDLDEFLKGTGGGTTGGTHK